MIQGNIDSKDLRRLMRKMDPVRVDPIIRRSLFKSATFIAGWIKDKRLSGPRPSFLGVVTGRLRSSISAMHTVKRGDAYIATIGTNVVYARRHKKGTYGMPARPFMRPAIEDRTNMRNVIEDLRREMRKALAR